MVLVITSFLAMRITNKVGKDGPGAIVEGVTDRASYDGFEVEVVIESFCDEVVSNSILQYDVTNENVNRSIDVKAIDLKMDEDAVDNDAGCS
ncbi:hypothetical protein NDU88_005721 [Pleurodeles waltl]|uniref:Uncharacterized protein n=1 Tax=Pleurodeles waltl TaxID=8319 RepID=A0AAV7TDG9_PLEWA|nr:hypothetical protein NDU88_005721 [Pleurodeles waltl]